MNKYAHIVNLYNTQNYSFSQIAKKLGLTKNTVSGTIRRAREDGELFDQTFEERVNKSK